jgi:hypothetical protein
VVPGTLVRLKHGHDTPRLVCDWDGALRLLWFRETRSFAWLHREALVVVANPEYKPSVVEQSLGSFPKTQ